jgi:hypothetical protein
VLSGQELVMEIEGKGSPEGKPKAQVMIADCGEL